MLSLPFYLLLLSSSFRLLCAFFFFFFFPFDCFVPVHTLGLGTPLSARTVKVSCHICFLCLLHILFFPFLWSCFHPSVGCCKHLTYSRVIFPRRTYRFSLSPSLSSVIISNALHSFPKVTKDLTQITIELFLHCHPIQRVRKTNVSWTFPSRSSPG